MLTPGLRRANGQDPFLVVGNDLVQNCVALLLAGIFGLAMDRRYGAFNRTFGAINHQINKVILFLR